MVAGFTRAERNVKKVKNQIYSMITCWVLAGTRYNQIFASINTKQI